MQAHREPPGDGLRQAQGAVDHRTSARVAAFGTSVQLGWWEGAEFRVAAGLLKDISRGGASALAEAAPPAGSPLFLRLDGGRLTDWLDATAVSVSKNRWFRRVPRLVRMSFHAPCPYHFFQAAVDVLIAECREPGRNPANDPHGPHTPRSRPRAVARRPGRRGPTRSL